MAHRDKQAIKGEKHSSTGVQSALAKEWDQTKEGRQSGLWAPQRSVGLISSLSSPSALYALCHRTPTKTGLRCYIQTHSITSTCNWLIYARGHHTNMQSCTRSWRTSLVFVLYVWSHDPAVQPKSRSTGKRCINVTTHTSRCVNRRPSKTNMTYWSLNVYVFITFKHNWTNKWQGQCVCNNRMRTRYVWMLFVSRGAPPPHPLLSHPMSA